MIRRRTSLSFCELPHPKGRGFLSLYSFFPGLSLSIQQNKILKTEFNRVVVRFPLPPQLTFYLKVLDRDGLERIWSVLDEISSKYDNGVSTKDMMVIYRNKKNIRVVVVTIPKRFVLDYRNIKEHIRTYLSTHAIVIPSEYGNENIYLMDSESLERFIDYVEKKKPEIDEINSRLAEYYNSGDYDKLLETIKGVASEIKELDDKQYLKYPRVLIERIVFDLTSDPKIGQYARDTIREYVMRFFEQVLDKIDIRDIKKIRDSLFRELSNAEKQLGIPGLSQFVEQLKEKYTDAELKRQRIEIVKEKLKAEFGEYLERFL